MSCPLPSLRRFPALGFGGGDIGILLGSGDLVSKVISTPIGVIITYDPTW